MKEKSTVKPGTKSYADRTTCAWTEDEDGNWWTDCGHGFVFIDGGPKENEMRFCCYCGLKIREKRVKP